MGVDPPHYESPLAARQRLIALVESGHLSRAEAEAEASRIGAHPLQRRPVFDPMREVHWSIVMVAAWISWRTPETVARFADEYQLGCTDWKLEREPSKDDGPYAGRVGTAVARWRMVQREPISLARALEWENDPTNSEQWFRRPQDGGELPEPQVSLAEARDHLFAEGQAGKLLAIAKTANDQAERVQLAPMQWSELREWTGHDGTDVLADLHAEPRRIELRAVRLDRARVLDLWPIQATLHATEVKEDAQGNGEQQRKPVKGRRPKYEWSVFRARLDELLDYHGLPDPHDPEWSDQAAVERSMAEWAEINMQVGGNVPAESLIRQHVADALAERRENGSESTR